MSEGILWGLLIFLPLYGLVLGLFAYVPLAREEQNWKGAYTALLAVCIVLSPILFVATIVYMFLRYFHVMVKLVIERIFHVR